MSTSSPTTTAEELIAESIMINVVNDQDINIKKNDDGNNGRNSTATNIVGDDNTATGQATTTTPKKKRRQQYSNQTKIQVKLALETRPVPTLTTPTSVHLSCRWTKHNVTMLFEQQKIHGSNWVEIGLKLKRPADGCRKKFAKETAETERRRAEKEKIRDDKKAETERRRAEEEQKVGQCYTKYCSECLSIICIIL